jgi:hypothetical protein
LTFRISARFSETIYFKFDGNTSCEKSLAFFFDPHKGNNKGHMAETKRPLGEKNMKQATSAISLVASAPEENYPLPYGSHWKRGLVEWSENPVLLCVQRGGTIIANMTAQQGWYVLFDGKKLVHTGKTNLDGLGACLARHTQDVFRSKWDHFSFIGFREVYPDGTLGKELKLTTSKRQIAILYAAFVLAHPDCEYSKRGFADAKMIRYKQVSSI